MKHLTPDEFVDIAEGVRAERDVPHLSACAACRDQLVDLRASLSNLSSQSASELPGGHQVPEPSPLFWDHFSARVREAVAAEGLPRRWNPWGPGGRGEMFGAFSGSWAAGVVSMAGAVALIIAAVALTSHVTAPGVSTPPASGAVEIVADVAALAPFGAIDDPVLSLIGDLMADLDLDGASEALLPSPVHAGDADDVVSTLTEAERLELQRLLQEELAKPHA